VNQGLDLDLRQENLVIIWLLYLVRGEKGKVEGKEEGRENLGGQAPQMFFPRTAPGN